MMKWTIYSSSRTLPSAVGRPKEPRSAFPASDTTPLGLHHFKNIRFARASPGRTWIGIYASIADLLAGHRRHPSVELPNGA